MNQLKFANNSGGLKAFLCSCLVVVAACRTAAAQQPLPAMATTPLPANPVVAPAPALFPSIATSAGLPQSHVDAVPAQPDFLLASYYNNAMQSPEQSYEEEFPRAPYWGMPNVLVTDPAEYPHPRSIENDNPDSFWYTYRPNIFNMPVPAEWDFYNLINTDRPDFTDAVYTVGKGVTYIETGYTFRKTNDATTAFSSRQLPEILLRYGLTKNFELRMKWNGYLMTDTRDRATGANAAQFGGEDLDLGFKWAYLQQKGWIPMLTVVAGILAPTGTNGMSANAAQPHFNLLTGWGLRRWAYLKTQFGCDFLRASNGQFITNNNGLPMFVTTRSGVDSWHESISLLTQWTQRIGAFHEWFMISNVGGGDNRAQHYLDTGLYIYATTNVQFDVRIGSRLSDRVNDVFTGAGISTRW